MPEIAEFPLVTIGLPVFNGMPTVGQSLETLLQIDYPNLQIIISDNASTDATLSVCRALTLHDSRVRILSKSQNEGAVANFRTVLDAADGEFFMWAAADDYWSPQFVSRLLPLLQKDSLVGVAMCSVDRRFPNGMPFDLIRFVGDNDPNGLGNFHLLSKILAGGKFNLFIYGLFRTRLLRGAIRNFPDVLGGDRQFICQIALATRFAYLDEVLLTRTHQPAHCDKYLTTMAQRGTLRSQLKSFSRMIMLSSVIPWERKAILPYASLQYAIFGLRQKPLRGSAIVKKVFRRFYLSLGLVLKMGVGIGSTIAVLGYCVAIGVMSPDLAAILIWITLVAVVSSLSVRSWIFNCQKTLVATVESAISRKEFAGAKATEVDDQNAKAGILTIEDKNLAQKGSGH